VPCDGALNLGIDDSKREITIYEKLGQHLRILKYLRPRAQGSYSNTIDCCKNTMGRWFSSSASAIEPYVTTISTFSI
jgi:hypothetical protein